MASGRGISVFRGDSKSLRVDVVRPDGTPYDLSDKRIVLTVKSSPEDSAVVLQKEASIGVNGSATFALTPEDTELDPEQYTFDIELSNLDRSFVRTVVLGLFTVRADITRAVR